MAVMAFEIGLDEMRCDFARLGGVAAGARDKGFCKARQRVGGDDHGGVSLDVASAK
jgi:hypothetical protein